MNKRGAGICFCFIAALLFSAKYISAAIFGSGVSSWNSQLYGAMLSYIGKGLDIASVLALIAGIIYLFMAENESKINKTSVFTRHQDSDLGLKI